MNVNRRNFIGAAIAAAAGAQVAPSWGGPVLDIHYHPGRQPGVEVAHMQGCGVTNAVLLARASMEAQVKESMRANPGKFWWFGSTDTAKPDAADILGKAVKSGGAIGMGELKSHVECDGPEMRRIYDLAAELGVPVLLHFQEVEHFKGEGHFNTGIKRLPALLKAHRKTTFIGHADGFWANISADVPGDIAYPTGKVKRGGLTDKVLADFPNMYGDTSANSGRNALNRDPEFTADFLKRHQNKLMFGSDCSCRDGRGTGQASKEPLIMGKCVARETLAALKAAASPEVFRKITWSNGVKLLKLKV